MAANGTVYLCIYSLADGDKHVLKVHDWISKEMAKARIRNMLPREGLTFHYFEACKDQTRDGWIREIQAAADAIKLDPSHVPISNRDLANLVAAESGVSLDNKAPEA